MLTVCKYYSASVGKYDYPGQWTIITMEKTSIILIVHV